MRGCTAETGGGAGDVDDLAAYSQPATAEMLCLFLEFRTELERDGTRAWSHMTDYDISFERLADAVEHVRAHLLSRLRTGSIKDPDERMRCKRTLVYDWPDRPPYNGQPIEAMNVEGPSPQGGSHYASWDRHGFGEALCVSSSPRRRGNPRHQ